MRSGGDPGPAATGVLPAPAARCAQTYPSADRFCEVVAGTGRATASRHPRQPPSGRVPTVCSGRLPTGTARWSLRARRTVTERASATRDGHRPRGLEHARNEDAGAVGFSLRADGGRPHAIAVVVCDWRVDVDQSPQVASVRQRGRRWQRLYALSGSRQDAVAPCMPGWPQQRQHRRRGLRSRFRARSARSSACPAGSGAGDDGQCRRRPLLAAHTPRCATAHQIDDSLAETGRGCRATSRAVLRGIHADPLARCRRPSPRREPRTACTSP